MEVRPADNSPPVHHRSPPLKQPKATPVAVDTSSVTQRLQKELMSLMMSGDIGVLVFPEEESIFTWIGTIEGARGSIYEGLSNKLSLRFPLDYPFKPPQVKFETPCFHPNVDQYGNICLDILQGLLGEPNTESPLNNHAADIWANQEEYRKMAHKQFSSGST